MTACCPTISNSCPSTGEENSALYNMACAYAQLKQQQSALTCIQGVLDNGESSLPPPLPRR